MQIDIEHITHTMSDTVSLTHIEHLSAAVYGYSLILYVADICSYFWEILGLVLVRQIHENLPSYHAHYRAWATAAGVCFVP